MRPSIILENGQRSEDDLTHKLVDIIRINQRFKENQDAGAPQLVMEDLRNSSVTMSPPISTMKSPAVHLLATAAAVL